MKAICFLGTTNYQSTRYRWEGLTHETRFFPAAVARFFKPARLLICATPTVQAHPNLAALQSELEDLGAHSDVLPIPESHSEADLWNIFDALTEAVVDGEEVIFDVTYSFRSLPFLAFLAIAYLKVAKRVAVARVLYGAFEAHSAENESPVFDLTPFVTLLDWLTATNRFVETGDGQALAMLLKAGMPLSAEMRDDLAARTLGRHLRQAADSIETVSLALRVTRPVETMKSAGQLRKTLEQALPSLRDRTRPFAVLADQVSTEYGQFAVDNPLEATNLSEGLWRQLKMVKWYLQRRQVVQAVTLAREWLVSVLAFCFNEPMFDLKNGRQHVETALNNAVDQRRGNPRPLSPSRCDHLLQSLPVAEELQKLWSALRDIRNDIAHVGMNLSPSTADRLKQQVEDLYPRLLTIAQALLPSPSVEIA
jgi:CRISPR-associated DxTHG motif protein